MKKTILTLAIAAFAAGTVSASSCGTHSKTAETASQTASVTEMPKNIVETATAAGNFTTLVAAVEAAGLVEALQGDGPFTVFAPTDEAFAQLPEGTVEALLKDPKKLASILTYHVVDGSVMSDQVAGLNKAQTLNGQDVRIAVKDGGVMIDEATVIAADIACSNGVIHVIDRVILPEM